MTGNQGRPRRTIIIVINNILFNIAVLILLCPLGGRAAETPPRPPTAAPLAASIIIRPMTTAPSVANPAKSPPGKAVQTGGKETVRIGGKDYPVPAPWAGNRVRVPEETAANLALIPRHLTLNGGEIALRREAAAALTRMAKAAQKEGIALQVDSGYRSANYQRQIWERRLAEGAGFAGIARHTAPPGYSRHSLGVAVDLVPSSSAFHKTRAYAWLTRHAGDYGFFEAYERGNSFGIAWEPWHWEYRMTEAEQEAAKTALAAKQAKETAAAAPPPPPKPWPQPFETIRRACAATLPRLAELKRADEAGAER